MATIILAQVALHTTKNAIIAIPKAISLPYAGNQNKIGNQMYLIDPVLEADPEGQGGQLQGQQAQDATGHTVEADNLTRALATAEAEVPATVEVPCKTTTINSFQDHHTRRLPRCNRRSPTAYKCKVSHFSLFQDHSPTNEGQLYTDKAPDGHRAFHTTLQLITRQGPKPLKVKVDPGADASIIPLSRYRSLFPHHFHTNGTLRSRSLRKTNATWSVHDGTTHNFIGFFTIDVQHKTKPDVIPISFYVFKDSTRPSTLLSYAASVHLGIIEFKVPNEANSHAIHSMKSKKKKISFSTPLCYSTPPTKSTPKKPQNRSQP